MTEFLADMVADGTVGTFVLILAGLVAAWAWDKAQRRYPPGRVG